MDCRPAPACLVLVIVGSIVVGPAAAQDEDLAPLLLYGPGDPDARGLDARAVQMYRIPLSYTVRRVEDHPWGLRITFPVSLGVHELEASTDLEDILTRLETATIVPGVEFVTPVGGHWQVKPFAEVGVTAATEGGGAELLYGVGLRSRGSYELRPIHLMVGGAATYKNSRSNAAGIRDFTTLELGADAQVPLGFAVGSRAARGGLYGIVRYFPDLEVESATTGPIDITETYEVGLSFATEPVLRLWKIRLPWIGIGYRFGDVFTGVRINLSFPF